MTVRARSDQVSSFQLAMFQQTSPNAGVIGFYRRIGYERAPVTVMQRWLDEDGEP